MIKPAQDFYKKLFRSLDDSKIMKAAAMPTYGIGHWDKSLFGPNEPNYELLCSFVYKVSGSCHEILEAANSADELSFFFRWDQKAAQSIGEGHKQLAHIATASLVMGHSTVVLTSPWHEYADSDEHQIHAASDYWAAIFSLRPLLLNGRVIVLPSDFTGQTAQQGCCSWNENPDYNSAISPNDHLLTIGKQETIEYCHRTGNIPVTREMPGKLPASMLPVVQIEDLERFLEFSNRYESSLSRFKAALAALVSSHEDNAIALKLEMNKALTELDDRLNILSRESRLKGVKFSLQAAAFVVASLSPSDVGQILRLLTGAGALLDGIDLLTTSQHTSATVRDSDFWFPWAWDRHNRKKTHQ